MNTTDTTDTNAIVTAALAGNYGIWADTDAGEFDLYGDDLRETWDGLAPGEGFTVLGIINESGRWDL